VRGSHYVGDCIVKDLTGRVAFITGAARGQGRSHALRLAEAGADIIAVDLCAQIDTVPYAMATPEDLAETVRQVEAAGRRIVASIADVRDEAALQSSYDAGVEALGPVDIVVANAGIAPLSLDDAKQAWGDVLDVNLTGVFHTVEVAKAAMVQRGAGGSIVLIGSAAGISGAMRGTRGELAYTAAKHGLTGLVKAYANALAADSIRVNAVHPTGVATPMLLNQATGDFFAAKPDEMSKLANAIPVDLLDAADISHAVLWLVSDEARYVTGVNLPVDAGFSIKK
jgi:SDR family mycofactocin-dependent oxidoreductase